MTAIPTPAGFDIGRVLQRLFEVLSRNFATFLLLSLLLVGLPTATVGVLQILVEAPTLATPGSAAEPNYAGFIAVPFVWLIGAAANAVLQGAVIHGAVSDLSGRKATFGEALGTGLRNLLPLIAVGLISAVCIFFGVLVFIVPGVLLALAWSVATPALVVERTGVFGAYGRSVELTRDCRIYIFALAIIFAVISFILQMVGGAVIGIGSLGLMAAGNGGSGGLIGVMVASTLASLVTQTFSALIGSAGIASVYYELRYVKEGVGAQQLAAVFD
jgi:hypothetical protein